MNTDKITSTNIEDTGTQINVSSDMYFGDSNRAYFGTGNDLSIYHGGTNSNIINENGGLVINNKDPNSYTYFKSGSSDEFTGHIFRNFSNTDVFIIYSDGDINAAGTITANSFSGNLSGTSTNTDNVGNKTSTQVQTSVDDTLAATEISTANTLVKRGASSEVSFGDITGTSLNLTGDIDMGDNDKILLGTGDNLEMYFGGSNSFIKNATGDFTIENSSGGDIILNPTTSNSYVRIDLSTTNSLSGFRIFDSASSKKFEVFANGNLTTYGNLRPNGSVDNLTDLGGGTRRWREIFAGNATINTSDERHKTEIFDSDLGLEFINNLRPVKYKWINGTRDHYGLIAQEVNTTLNGKDFAGYIDCSIREPEADILGLRYTEFISPLIKAIQELTSEINHLKSRIEILEG